MKELNPLIAVHRAAGRLRAGVTRHATPCWVSLFAVVLGTFVWRQHGEASRVAGTVSESHPGWLIALLLLNLSIIVVAATSYQVVLRRLGHKIALKECARIHLQRHVVGTVTPIGGPASIYVLIRALGRRNVSVNDALFTTTIRSAVGYTAFIAILIPALVLQRPSLLILGASGALALILVLVLTTMTILLGHRGAPQWLMLRAPATLTRFLANACAHQIRPRDLGLPFLLSLTHNAAGALSVFLCLQALGIDGALGVALVGYAIGNLFTIIAPVFQGLGVVELTMALALHQQGVPMTAAFAVTMLYRLGDVWFPLLLGGFSHLAGITAVRQIAARAAPAVGGAAAAALLMIAPIYAGTPDMLQSQFALTSSQAVTFVAAALAAFWLVGAASGAWKRQAMQQVMPVACLVLAVPLIALLATSVDMTVPF